MPVTPVSYLLNLDDHDYDADHDQDADHDHDADHYQDADHDYDIDLLSTWVDD